MKFRLVQQEQAKCAHPLRSARPGELSFATRESERVPAREETWRDAGESERGTESEIGRERGEGEREQERQETYAGWMGWCNTVIANNGTTMRESHGPIEKLIYEKKSTSASDGHRQELAIN